MLLSPGAIVLDCAPIRRALATDRGTEAATQQQDFRCFSTRCRRRRSRAPRLGSLLALDHLTKPLGAPVGRALQRYELGSDRYEASGTVWFVMMPVDPGDAPRTWCRPCRTSRVLSFNGRSHWRSCNTSGLAMVLLDLMMPE